MFVFLLTTLNTHFISPLSVSILFKRSKRVLNIDSNGHKKPITHKNPQKRHITTKTLHKKHVLHFYR